MESLKDALHDLINVQYRELFQIEETYDVLVFETIYENSTKDIITYRISPINSPRYKEYQNEEYVTPPGTPRITPPGTPRENKDPYNVEISILCKYIKIFKDEFINKLKDLINKYFNEVPNDLIINYHLDRVTIKFSIQRG